MKILTSMKVSLKVIIFQSLYFLLKPNFACEDIWLRAETAKEKLKQDTHTHYTVGMKGMPFLNMIQLEAVSQQLYFPREGRKGVSGPTAQLITTVARIL